jgi:hypothetical protein
MRKSVAVFSEAALIAVFGSGLALAQSSGNFSSTAITPSCAIATGQATTGVSNLKGPTCTVGGSTPATGSFCGLMSSSIKTSSGSGVTLKVTPSLVTGLFTDTNVTSNKNTSGISTEFADVGVQVCVTVDAAAPATVKPPSCVIYDQRFQQLSTNLFSVVSGCALTTAAACCATNTCTTATDINSCGLNCNIDLILSTLSAHSFDFVVPVGGGQHTLTATWSVFGSNSAGGTTAACVGPGVITVEQVKVFNNSGSLLTF